MSWVCRHLRAETLGPGSARTCIQCWQSIGTKSLIQTEYNPAGHQFACLSAFHPHKLSIVQGAAGHLRGRICGSGARRPAKKSLLDEYWLGQKPVPASWKAPTCPTASREQHRVTGDWAAVSALRATGSRRVRRVWEPCHSIKSGREFGSSVRPAQPADVSLANLNVSPCGRGRQLGNAVTRF